MKSAGGRTCVRDLLRLRLARFNIQGMAPGGGSRYFIGLPCPAGAGLLVAWVQRNQNSHRGLALVGRVDGGGDGAAALMRHRTISEL